MLTYETIRKIVSDEKMNTKLSELPDNFFRQVRTYLEKKAEINKDKEDRWELDSAMRVLQDLLEIRERKLLTLALYYVRSGVTPENMTLEENELFNSLVMNIKEFQAKRKSIMSGEEEKKKLIAMLSDLPEFIGKDMKNYGPFVRGDVATLPEENARLLIEKGIAKEIAAN